MESYGETILFEVSHISGIKISYLFSSIFERLSFSFGWTAYSVVYNYNIHDKCCYFSRLFLYIRHSKDVAISFC